MTRLSDYSAQADADSRSAMAVVLWVVASVLVGCIFGLIVIAQVVK